MLYNFIIKFLPDELCHMHVDGCSKADGHPRTTENFLVLKRCSDGVHYNLFKKHVFILFVH
jgi:hypothetical protein